MIGLRYLKILCAIILFGTSVYIFSGYRYYVASIPNLLHSFTLNFTTLEDDDMHNFTCGLNRQFIVEVECRTCSQYEIKAEKACVSSGNVKRLKCAGSKHAHLLPCPVAFKFEAQKFWIFEGFVIGLALFANIAVWWRRRVMDSYFRERIIRQVALAEV